MLVTKKIVFQVLKLIIGISCILILYFKLEPQLTKENIAIMAHNMRLNNGFILLLMALCLMFVNWGIEAFKWQAITQQVQTIKYGKAFKSVFSGVCIGNLAPGRATEFFGKIIYFDSEYRPAITVLHFVNGLFQLIVTVFFGCLALSNNLHVFSGNNAWVADLSIVLSVIVALVFVLMLVFLNKIINLLTKKLAKQNVIDYDIKLTKSLLLKLILGSFVRYFVFCLQFLLVLKIFRNNNVNSALFFSMMLYFLFTTIIPMISFVEPAIRATIALIVFAGTGFTEVELSLAALLVWIMNIILPSLMGYLFLVQQKFDFKLR